MNKCPFFGLCGGCKYDFASDEYKQNKQAAIKNIPITNEPVWLEGKRRRAEFSYSDGKFGFFAPQSKNIVPVTNCSLLNDNLNEALSMFRKLPWNGAGSVLITDCDNGLDVAITSTVPFFSPELKSALEKTGAVRISWNDKVIAQKQKPMISFENKQIEYPVSSFLQPSIKGEEILRNLVVTAASGYKKIVDLFCGIGTFTYATGATGFDIVGPFINRDLLKNPLSNKNLNQFDCVIMDPPRAGAMKQSSQLAKSDVKKIIYVSCNPDTFMRDKAILESGGYKLESLTAVDQFIGTAHWELVGVFVH